LKTAGWSSDGYPIFLEVWKRLSGEEHPFTILAASNYKTWNELTTEALKGRAVWEYTQGKVAEA